MLDTDTANYLFKGKSRAIEARLAALVPSMICVSVMTRAELQYGLKRLPGDHRLHLAVRQFLKDRPHPAVGCRCCGLVR